MQLNLRSENLLGKIVYVVDVSQITHIWPDLYGASFYEIRREIEDRKFRVMELERCNLNPAWTTYLIQSIYKEQILNITIYKKGLKIVPNSPILSKEDLCPTRKM